MTSRTPAPRPLRHLASIGIAVLLALAGRAEPVSAQITAVSLTDAGRTVPVDLTAEQVTMGRAIAHGLLANARRDVTRPVTDDEVAALGRRGTLLQIRLARAESVFLVRLGSSARASRLAAYVPPGEDDHAYVFLGRSGWQRIVVVSLPATVRRELRTLRGRASDG